MSNNTNPAIERARAAIDNAGRLVSLCHHSLLADMQNARDVGKTLRDEVEAYIEEAKMALAELDDTHEAGNSKGG